MSAPPPATPGPDTPARPPRPRLAFVVNTLTPYRVESQMRVKHEIPQFDIDTYIHWDVTKNPWVYKELPDIGVVTFKNAIYGSGFKDPRLFWGDWKIGGEIIRLLRRARPTAVVVGGYGYPAPFRVMLWCKLRRIPVMMWGDSNIHSDVLKGWKGVLKQLGVPLVVRLFNALLVCGENGVRYYLRYRVPRDRIFFSPVEPDYKLIEATTPEQIARVGATYGLARGRRRLVICSRLVPVKAVDQGIDAFCQVAYQRPEWDLVILGDGPLREMLEERVPGPLRDRVIFAGFQDDQSVVNAVYKQSDVLLHPAVWEPWGVVILEAAAAGLAIITTRVVGAAHEFARDGINGRVTRPNDRRDLARAILEVTDPAKIDGLKAASLRLSAEFRRDHDPVVGLRNALTRCGVRVVPGT